MSVVYNVGDLDVKRKVTVKASNEPLSTIMEQILQGTALSYAIEKNYIVLFTKSPERANTQNEAINIKGRVSDNVGEPLAGVSVQVVGQSTGTVTDIDGHFKLSVPASGKTLIFSYIGYSPRVEIISNRNQIDIILEEDARILEEVVVTAMGINREAKTLTYATQTIKSEELTRAKDANFINSLQGKSAGLIITPNAGGAGSASKILLRGNTSIMGENTPLVVVDGVPMQNKVQGQFGDSGGYNMAYSARSEGSDALSNINPEDVESVTVLKGANAAALYGYAAGNGVLIITTKQGKAGKISIDFSSNSTFETPLVLPKLQNQFGAGIKSDSTLTASSWGKPINELTNDELAIPGVSNNPYNIADFFRTGTNFTNSISISGGSENIRSYFSYGNTTATGIIPNNNFKRHSISFKQSFDLLSNKKLKIEVSANYVHQETNNRISGGTVYNPLYNLYLAPRNLDMNYYKNYESFGAWKSEPISVLYPSGSEIKTGTQQVDLTGMKQNWFLGRGSSGENNPFWLINRSNNQYIDKYFRGGIDVKYTIIDGLTAQGRFKYNRIENSEEDIKYATTVIREGTLIDRGQSDYASGTSYDMFTDFMLSYNKTFHDFSIASNLGASLDTRKSKYFWMRNTGPGGKPYYIDIKDYPLTINYFYPDASLFSDRSFTPDSDWDKALFATATVGYKDIAFLDATYRIDWTRTYTQFSIISDKKNVRPYFDYYSIGGNVLLDKLINLGDKIDLMKLRTSYSVVGNPLPNKQLNAAMQKKQKDGAIVAVDISAFDPEPEITRSLEAGADLSFFHNLIDFNFTFYNAVSEKQFLQIPSTLGQIKPANSGEIRNRGVESTIGFNFMLSKDFYWKTGFNYAYNDNKIIATYKNRTDIKVIIGTSDNLRVRFLEGGSYGDLYAKDFLRYNKFDEEAGLGKAGDIILDAQGNPSLSSRGGHNVYLGNINSKVHMGWHNTFRYKNLSAYFLIDGKLGGKVVSFTEAYLDGRGVSNRSAEARTSGLKWTDKNGATHPAAIMPDGNLASAQKYYETIGSQIFPSEYVYDATNFRLREASVGYTFPKISSIIKSATISLVGRNLFFLYKNAPVDPDVSQSTANGLGGVDIFSLPTTRSYGLNVKLSF
jgi:TonB-linked SusC/RagA family outer membrane protein